MTNSIWITAGEHPRDVGSVDFYELCNEILNNERPGANTPGRFFLLLILPPNVVTLLGTGW